MVRWIIFLIVFGAIDFYAFQAVRTLNKSVWITVIYWALSLIVVGSFIYLYYDLNRSDFGNAHGYAFAFLATLYVPKMLILVVMFGEDVFRWFSYGLNNDARNIHADSSVLASRRKFISQLALGLAAVPFISFLYGIYRGKYNYKVLNYVLHFEDLPEAFDGYKITQISDLHTGSFDNKNKVEYGVDLINEQQSDIIVFTGDMVNNKADELLPYVDIFKKLEAKDGMYSVLGNHDYGDYIRWPSDDAKAQNLEDLKRLQNQIGFDLLLNENRFIERNGERIAIIGVENWGKGGFKKAGDLKKASAPVNNEDFKVLLSHDPSHWEAQVIPDQKHFHLTLSGHTHGMQFGIEIPGWFKWSPVKWRYKQWAGIYEQLGQFINVNRGFGYLAFPGRVGIWPEITVVELKKRKIDV